MSKKKMICVSSVLLALSLVVCAVTVRFHRVDCAHCKKNIYMLSGLEMTIAYWRDIPMLHKDCLNHISNILAPEAGLTVAEYLEARGWNLRHSEIKGKTWKELVNGKRNN